MAEESIEQIKALVVKEINEITIEKVNDLVGIWSNLFESSIVKQNIKKLVSHVESFHAEVFEETAERQRNICSRIKELREEQHRLQRILQTNVDVDVDISNRPLFNYQMELDHNLDELRDQLERRQRQIEELIKAEEHFCATLDIDTQRLTYDPLPSAQEIKDFENHLESLKREINVRSETFQHLKHSIRQFAVNSEIDMKQELRFGILNKSDLTLSKANLSLLQQLNNDLAKEKLDIEAECNSQQKKLQSLYKCLEMTPKKEFVNFNRFTKTGINLLNSEINRCEKIKRQNIQRVVENVRSQIKEYWTLTLKSDKEIARFPNFTSDCYTDDLLVLHEMELADLKKFYADNEEIFNKFTEHNTLWERMLALEAKENEPGRFNNRGGQLLLEEKERKTISSKLPKLRAEITRMAQSYEMEQRRKFLVHGRDLEEVINEVYENRREVKVQQKSARKAGVATGTTGLTPGHRNVIRTPMSVSKIGHTSALKRIASNTNICSSASTKKTKMETTAAATPTVQKTAKRNILSQLGAASASAIHKFVKPKAGTKTHKVVDTLSVSSSQRRRSRRRSSNKSLKKHTTTKPIPQILISDTSHSESVISYDAFESHMSTRTPCRSSVLPKENTPYKLRSPKYVRQVTPHSVKASSSRLMTSRLMPISPAIKRTPSPRSKKLTTKNLPIII